MPGPESSHKTQDRFLAESEPVSERGIPRRRMKQIRVHSVGHDVDLGRIDAPFHDVIPQRTGDGQQGVGPGERPLLGLCAKIAETVAAIGSLLDRQWRVQFDQPRHTQRLGDDCAGRAIERGAFVDEIRRIPVEPARQLRDELLVGEDVAQFAGHRAVETQLLDKIAHVLGGRLRAGTGPKVHDVGGHLGRGLPRRLVEHGRRQHDLVSRPRERANHLTHVN